MNMGERTYYVSHFIDELYLNGLENVVISPGSRSTPLAMTFSEHPSINEWIHFDERSSAFFALGMAKRTKKPVALVCTSGTAAANYYPAIVEAYYSRVPLIVLTSDRPHELRDNGAPQAIDQIKMYGDYTKYFHEMAIPEDSEQMIKYARRQASRAYAIANHPNQGVVQLNFPFRDPLIPDLTLDNLWGEHSQSYVNHITGQEQITSSQINTVMDLIKDKKRGLLICGELKTHEERDLILQLAEKWQIPIFADVLSNLRKNANTNEYVISSYDALLKQEDTRNRVEADFVIRFGSMPVSKPYTQWLTKTKPEIHIVIDENQGYREPTNIESTMVFSNPATFLKQLLDSDVQPSIDSGWHEQWTKADQLAQEIIKKHEANLTEGTAVLALSESDLSEQVVFVGNSMPIRDMDTFFLPSKQNIDIMANRGANGIDGVISTALGVAATGTLVTLVIGDVSFLHDYTALFIARQYRLPFRVIVLNNNGGGIFSFLPQYGEKKHFEALFGTPFDPPIAAMTEAIGFEYHQPSTYDDMKHLLDQPIKGLELFEVVTNRDENMKWHRQKWEQVDERIKREGLL
ncbi:2-succinyl-5-enolpyruvyl-6-hydroxy-3-cyclohexene-1-carboxylic-acid synthase [Tenuibacillus multivorans]|uniref:2-succinyl-5-enolpyruvyl-6-hydroxy-3-cyclohexene-1-carboxylate synthase n=1 Tax=Tenuibacillus multivorans TaxID=237069 RepID=A0A1H0FR32_9BACI|nr:2-succinyl-5-enolpyruvyl-6-hydroxy-3-cyclohexene-1-carboxylic-acid synthase [Tenuibacillus multivorans]GEL77919.1 2-succinyl-5-enolpyruvyl-6-hydroxy-3-cyclohexene-1-carboxylate synthase [Tenuibacillus multivorans]SDN97097.1 2-succinyl-5-enolpyruvyl-6-hydroxy-3-cyclohexene-1-carboxylate synthase [Tenuibacillus multivorans]